MADGAVLLEQARNLWPDDQQGAFRLYDQLIKDERDAAIKEKAILELAENLKTAGRTAELEQLMELIRPFLTQISKAKAAKLVRILVDYYLASAAGKGQRTGHEVDVVKRCIAWAESEKRLLLKQSIEAKLISLYYEMGRNNEALELSTKLLRELKKIDEKQLLLEVHLLESKVYYASKNVGQARASLTSGKTIANSIYVGPRLQAELDLQSGILHAAEDDFKTAYSYFIESFEGYDSQDEKIKAVSALKYMILAKIMVGQSDEVSQVVSYKNALKYKGRHVDAMKAVSEAAKKRSLADFGQALTDYHDELRGDVVIEKHLTALQEKLLEENLQKILEPFSKVQVSHVAKLIGLSVSHVEVQLSKMILDKKLTGIMDQGAGVLFLYEEQKTDQTYEMALDVIKQMGDIVDQLCEKAQKLS